MSKDNKKYRGFSYSIKTPTKKHYVYSELYAEYYPQVYRMAMKYSDTIQDAEDVTQEIFMRLLINWNRLDFRNLAKCISITSQQTHSNWFKYYVKRGADVYSYDDLFLPDADWNHPTSDFGDPYQEMINSNLLGCFEDKFRILKDDDKRLLNLIYGEGYTIVEASEVLEISKTAAENRVWRAKQLMETCYKREDFL
jgi:RNA polymerase sigma-70 factor (ECF subfamily)